MGRRKKSAAEALVYGLAEYERDHANQTYLDKMIRDIEYLRTVLSKEDTSWRIRVIATPKLEELERFVYGESFASYLGTPRVGHVAAEKCDVYIGRQSSKYNLDRSIWANPFKITEEVSREQVLDRYMKYLIDNEELCNHIPKLTGKTLGCWCKSTDNHDFLCHGDILTMFHLEWSIECWRLYGFSGYQEGIGIFNSPYTGKVVYDIRKRWKALMSLPESAGHYRQIE